MECCKKGRERRTERQAERETEEEKEKQKQRKKEEKGERETEKGKTSLVTASKISSYLRCEGEGIGPSESDLPCVQSQNAAGAEE